MTTKSVWIAALIAASVAARPAAAELSANAQIAAQWQAEKQLNELELVNALRDAFENHVAIQASVRELGLILIDRLQTDLNSNDPDTRDAVSDAIAGAIRGYKVGDPNDTKREIAGKTLRALEDTFRDANARIRMQVLGDLMYAFAQYVSYNGGDARTAMRSTQRAIGNVSEKLAWNEKSSVAAVGRFRRFNGDAGFTEAKKWNDAGDVAGIHAAIAREERGSAVARTVLAAGSVIATMERSYGLTLGADLSGSTNLYLWLIGAFETNGWGRDPIWKLLPIVTMVADRDHMLVEVATVLSGHGFIDYKVGDYTTLLPSSNHPAGQYIADILKYYTENPRNRNLRCWYGADGVVVACRRADGQADRFDWPSALGAYQRVFDLVLNKGGSNLNQLALPAAEAFFN